jgi:hypothetical protein
MFKEVNFPEKEQKLEQNRFGTELNTKKILDQKNKQGACGDFHLLNLILK